MYKNVHSVSGKTLRLFRGKELERRTNILKNGTKVYKIVHFWGKTVKSGRLEAKKTQKSKKNDFLGGNKGRMGVITRILFASRNVTD